MQVRWRVAQYFELLWWRTYLQNRAPHDYLAQKKQYWRRVLDTAGIVVPPGARVLDAGCGPAGIFTLLDRQHVDAVDPLLAAYERDLPHFQRADYKAYTRFFAEPLETFSANVTYDYVFCLNAINHVDRLGACLDRLVALTRPGGTLVVSVDAHRQLLLRKLFGAIPGDVLHPHQYTLDEYIAMLRARGVQLASPLLLKPGRIFDYYLLKGIRCKLHNPS